MLSTDRRSLYRPRRHIGRVASEPITQHPAAMMESTVITFLCVRRRPSSASCGRGTTAPPPQTSWACACT